MSVNRKSSTTLIISAVAFVAAFLIDLYLILVYPSMVQVIIAVSLIVIVDTYFLVDGILAKVDEITSLNLDKQNELTKVEKGIYSVAKREEISRNQSMSAILDMILEMKDENTRLLTEIRDDNSEHAKSFLEQDKLMTKIRIKKDTDNTGRVVTSTEKLAVLITKMATANSMSSNETIDILNDICRELEEKNEQKKNENEHSHLRVVDKAE